MYCFDEAFSGQCNVSNHDGGQDVFVLASEAWPLPTPRVYHSWNSSSKPVSIQSILATIDLMSLMPKTVSFAFLNPNFTF